MLMARVLINNYLFIIWWHLIFCLFDLEKKAFFKKTILLLNNKAKSSCATRVRLGFYINGMDLDIIVLIHKSYISSN